jgi:hypothetical protein
LISGRGGGEEPVGLHAGNPAGAVRFGFPRLCWLWKTLNDRFGRDAFETTLEQFREIENDLKE